MVLTTKIYECYENGKQRLNQIFKQEILELESIDTTGRRAKEVLVSKVIALKKNRKKTKANRKRYLLEKMPYC